ncbi:ROK family transcriptional regulator [Aestuariivirga sp.]|uniref:ROK family transcriptional regulator n=1 Tax=Aestuariivirga sp. TaxID=2650926 RepID=UPI0039E5AD2E
MGDMQPERDIRSDKPAATEGNPFEAGPEAAADFGLTRRGTTQTGVRIYHERLALSLIRTHGNLSKAEIARLTGLSAQTVSVIVRGLERDHLVLKGESVRGRVGQPSQPYSLNPDGAFALGLKVGRRSGDLVLIDLAGRKRHAVHIPYHFPTPMQFLAYARAGLDEILASLPRNLHKRIAGLGIAAPFELWNWGKEIGAPDEVMDAWREFNLTAEIMQLCDWPVMPCNDATAACAAELLFGTGHRYRDFAYLYVGYFAGGGLVINGQLHQGPTGNAAAFGSLPVPKPGGGSEQLIHSASLYKLERALFDAGNEPGLMWRRGDDWSGAEAQTGPWIAGAARGLAFATASIASVVDCPAIIIDGAMPPAIRHRLVEATRAEAKLLNMDGITPFAIEEGTIGIDARALGAASLPLFANFMADRDVLFKESA